jgi:outer membrane protein assembly factor BamD (BamD/ComL family)
MPYKIKSSPKSIPADEAHLRSGLEHFWNQAQAYRRTIAAGAALLAIAVLAVAVALWWEYRNAEQAAELERQALRLYLDRPVTQPAKADENLKQAIVLYERLVEEYPRSPQAPLALYSLGNARVQSNDIAGAIEAYNRYISAYGTNKALLGMVYQRLGYAYLLNGDRDKASRAWAAVLEVPGSLNKDQALFELGKLEESQSRPEGALARYQELTKSYPNSPFAGEAAVRMKALEVKQTPAPAPQTPAPSPRP